MFKKKLRFKTAGYKCVAFIPPPGGQTTLSSRRPSEDALTSQGCATSQTGEKDKEDRDVHDGRLSVFIHKREDQSSHEVIQPLLSSDSRPFRLGGGANMERVVRMDREMSKVSVVGTMVFSSLLLAVPWTASHCTRRG